MITRLQLAYYGPNGERVMDFDHQPSTNDMALHRHDSDQLVVQLIGNLFEVYSLISLRSVRHSGLTIGLPIAEHEDYDVAVMTALLTCN